jgi:hypothetical protein
MEGYSTKLDWRGGPDYGWWVELLKEGVRVAYMSLDEWNSDIIHEVTVTFA